MHSKFYFLITVLLFISNLALAKATPDEKITYKVVNGSELKLHVFYPEGHSEQDNRPAIVFFFGGSWNWGKPLQFYEHSRYLASRGMVAISAEYRIKSSHKSTPFQSVEDAKSAVRWVRQHASSLGIDPNKVAAGGGSAGGHLAAATGTTTLYNAENEDLSVSSWPNALVLFNPVYDNGPNGFGHERVKANWRELSPMHNIQHNTPPTIVFFGTKDKHVPIETAKEYKKLMEAKQRRCDLFIYQDQPHGFFNFKNKHYFTETVSEMDNFLVSLGFLSGKANVETYLANKS